jgi:hypothetical protein
MPSGPRANAGGASTRQLAPRQIAANQGRRQLERVERAPVFRSDAFSSRGPVPTPLENALVKAGIAAVILALSVFNERNGVAAQCAPERGCGASIDGSFHRHDRGQMRQKTGAAAQTALSPESLGVFLLQPQRALTPDNPDEDQPCDRRSYSDHAQDIVRRRQRTLHRPAHPCRAGREHQAFDHKQNTHTDEEVGERYGPHRAGTSRLTLFFDIRVEATSRFDPLF